MAFTSFTGLNSKSYSGQPSYLVETTWFPAQQLVSQLEIGHIFTHIFSTVLRPGPEGPTGALGFRRRCSSPLAAIPLLSRWRLFEGQGPLRPQLYSSDHEPRTWRFRILSSRTSFHFQSQWKPLSQSVLKRTLVSLVCAPLGARNGWLWGGYLEV